MKNRCSKLILTLFLFFFSTLSLFADDDFNDDFFDDVDDVTPGAINIDQYIILVLAIAIIFFINIYRNMNTNATNNKKL